MRKLTKEYREIVTQNLGYELDEVKIAGVWSSIQRMVPQPAKPKAWLITINLKVEPKDE